MEGVCGKVQQISKLLWMKPLGLDEEANCGEIIFTHQVWMEMRLENTKRTNGSRSSAV
jgi:hypothetical protein